MNLWRRKPNKKPINIPTSKYVLFMAAYAEEQKNGDKFDDYIEVISCNGWRQQYDIWSQCIRE